MDSLINSSLHSLERLSRPVQALRKGENLYSTLKATDLKAISNIHKSPASFESPVLLVILDWGQRDNFRANSIAAAKTPVNGLVL